MEARGAEGREGAAWIKTHQKAQSNYRLSLDSRLAANSTVHLDMWLGVYHWSLRGGGLKPRIRASIEQVECDGWAKA